MVNENLIFLLEILLGDCSFKSLSMQSLEFSLSHLCHTNTVLRKVLSMNFQWWKMGTNGQNGPFEGLTYGLLFHQWAQNYEGSFLFPSENSRDEALFFVLLVLFFFIFLLLVVVRRFVASRKCMAKK